MFDIIGKDINSVNLYFWGAALINKRGGEKFQLGLEVAFPELLLKIMSGP